MIRDKMAFLDKKILEHIRVEPGKKVRLKDYPPDWMPGSLRKLPEEKLEELLKQQLTDNTKELIEEQAKLYAQDRYSVLVVLQAMDAAGKDGIVKHVMSGLNPQGCSVSPFKAPSSEELDHDFLWRCVKQLPERGKIGIFNRSYYEEVLVVKVHPAFLEKQKLPAECVGNKIWEERYESINDFEKHLSRSGTRILKIFLHVSKEEQKRRFLERLEFPEKNWKFSLADLKERQYWPSYMRAYEEMLKATSTKWAPWHVVPADNKPLARLLVSELVTRLLQALPLDYPKLSQEEMVELAAAKKDLESEA